MTDAQTDDATEAATEEGGTVYLVGAGPGDPGLMTARALELVAAADVIYYDRLIPPTALDGARDDAELVYVGKQPGVPSVPQEEIGQRLIDSGKKGLSVVRLKGGDPYLFGRGAEEAEDLEAAGVNFEVVPGVTAGIAATAYAGIPVTHRDDASAVAFITGHEDPTKPETALDWPALASFPGTLVFYMGIKRLPDNVAQLIAGGRSPDEPAAAVQQGTTPDQRVVVATLATIADEVVAQSIKAPALIVVGSVARHREKLSWFEDRPLFGKKVVVTRARAQASGFARRLRSLGAEAIELPAIRIEPVPTDDKRIDEAFNRFLDDQYDLICFTSANGVDAFFDLLRESKMDARDLAGLEVAVIGPGTSRALEDHGITADYIPERFVAEGLLERLEDVSMDGKGILIARAEEARDLLPETLRQRNASIVDVMPLYRTVAETPDASALEAAAAADYVTFTSASTVKNLMAAMPEGLPAGAKLVSIGPITSEAAREAGLEVAIEAKRYDIDGLLEALLSD